MPVFLFPTPSQSSVLYATVGQNFQITAAAQAYHARYVWLKFTAAGCTKTKIMAVTPLFVCPLLCPEGLVASRWAAQRIWTKPSKRGKMEKPSWPSTGSRSSGTPTDRLPYASRQRRTRRENLRTALVRFLVLQTSLWNLTFVIQPVRNEVCCCHGDPVHAPSRSVNHLYPVCLWNKCNILMCGNVGSHRCDHWPKGPTPQRLTNEVTRVCRVCKWWSDQCKHDQKRWFMLPYPVWFGDIWITDKWFQLEEIWCFYESLNVCLGTNVVESKAPKM